MSKLHVYNGKEWIEIAKNGNDAIVDYEKVVAEVLPLVPVIKGDKGDPGADGHIKDLAPQEVRDLLELLQGEERLDVDAVRGVDVLAENIAKRVVNDAIEDIEQVTVVNAGSSGSTGVAESFETVSKNLDASDATLNYTGDNLTSIEYANGITKTLNYTGENLTSVVLSGSTPSGITLTKTLSYDGSDNLTGVEYS